MVDRLGGSRTAVRVVLLLAVGVLFWSGSLDRLQQIIEDGRFSAIHRDATGQLLLVDIDEPSIKTLGVWPWSRATHAAILDRLVALGATDVAFDIDFSSPSSPDGDAAFENALKRADGSVILAAFQQLVRTGADGTALIESKPLPRFSANAWEASVSVWPDQDGDVRQLRRGERFGAVTLPSLAALLASQSGRLNGAFKIDYGIDYGQLAHVSVRDLLRGDVDASSIKGRKAIVGASAVELKDLFQVPRFGYLSGSAVQAMAVESILQKRALEPVDVSQTLLLMAVVLGALCLVTRRLPIGSALFCCAAAALATEVCAIAGQAVWPVVPISAPIHVGALGLAAILIGEEGVSRRMKLLASRRGASRLRAILDRVIADNFAGIVIVDQDGRIRAASAAATALLGTDVGGSDTRRYGEVLPQPLADLVSAALKGLDAGRVEPLSACEARIAPAGRPTVLLDCVTTVSEIAKAEEAGGLSEHAICLTFRDITAERQAHDKLFEMARIDALSGLANRAMLLAAVQDRVARPPAGCSALVFVDIDRFKLVNDRLGHGCGDALIQAVSQRLRSAVASGDVAARLGGNEFAVVVGRATRPDIESLVNQLGSDLAGTYDIGVFQPAITVSIGYVLFEEQDTSEMMSCADTALNAAKASGGGCVRLYDAEMARKTAEGDQLAHDLRIALDRGEFEVAYQRQVDGSTERIVGVEALVRWKHPVRGYVSPAVFIPIAERTGLIEPIGALVLTTACRDALGWSQPIKVSVNLSAVQLARANLADLILATLAETGLPPARLELELTESLLLDDDDVVKTTLRRLREAGVKISLDDFGTGYSSLSYLHRFEIDKVKIDQSFIRTLIVVPSAIAIVRAVVALARDIGLRVNAEGVETVEQLHILQQLGCDEVQGYLHGRPEPSAAIEASLTRNDATSKSRAAA